MARIVRGDIYWADLEPVRGREQAGHRSILVLSREIFNDRSGTIIALAITGRRPSAGFPLTYAVPERILPQPSWVKISQIRTLSTERLGRKLGRIAEGDVDRILEGLLDIIGS